MTEAPLMTTAPARADPMQMIATLIEKGVSVADMKDLFELKRRQDEEQAALAYADAVTEFQLRCPSINKKRKAEIKGRDGNSGWGYSYASYDDIDFEIRPLLNECRLVVSFSSQLIPAAKAMEIVCTIRHGTYATEHKMTVPIPGSAMNDAQAYGSALSYAKRYALTAALNIIVTDSDDDAQRAKMTMVTDEELKRLEALLAEKRVDLTRFLNWCTTSTGYPVEKLEDIDRAFFKKAEHTLTTYPDPKTDKRPAVKPVPKKGAK